MGDRTLQGRRAGAQVAAGLAARLGATAALAGTPLVGILLGRATWALGSDVADALASAPTLSLATVTLGEALTVIAGAAGTATAGYLTIVSALLVMSPRGSRARHAAIRLTPLAWRRIVGAAVAGALSAGLAGPAMASPNTSDAGWVSEPIEQARDTTPRPEPVPQLPPPATGAADTARPDAPSASVAEDPSPASTSETASAAADSYVVVAGDSLWSITVDALHGADGTHDSAEEVATVAEAWPELYEANRDVIGADPSLIHPGIELSIPEGWAR